MSTQALLWLCIGAMAGVALSMVAMRLWNEVATRRWWLLPVLAVPVLAVLVYLQVGSPNATGTTPVSVAADALPEGHAATNATANDAGSMADVTAKLVSKLAAGQGTEADWQLLQQAYTFMGDTAAAALAAQHQLPDAATNAASKSAATNGVATLTAADVAAVANAVSNKAGGTTQTSTTPVSTNKSAVPARATQELLVYQQAVQQHPKDAKAWLALAQAQRSARNFTASVAAFAKVLALGKAVMDANAWADYADAAASVSGSLSNDATRKALDSALQMQPTHNKALWLKASLLLEEHQYAQSLKVWQQLRAALPTSSPDVSIIEANIAEAQSLAGQYSSGATKPVAVRITGTAQVAAALKAKASTGMTLFVYAKAIDSPMPVAVYRVAVTQWPVKFVLDDSSAMIAGRSLSQFASVTVEARLSRSGQASAQAGDLQSEAITVNPHAAQALTLTLSKQVS